MGLRNVNDTITLIQNRIPREYNLSLYELDELYNFIQSDLFHGIVKTFDYGFVLGARCYANGKINKSIIYGCKKRKGVINMANFEIMETGISTVAFSEIQNYRLKQSTQKIMKLMQSAKKNLFEIAVTLKRIDSESLYEQDGFQNVAEYGEKVLGYKRLMTSNLIRVASTYINDDMKSILASETKDYSVSQLQELLTISVDEAQTLNDNQIITPDMTTREIRKAVKDYKTGETVIDVESDVDETETETQTENENGFNKAYESFHEHYNKLREYLDGTDNECLDDLQSIMDSVVAMYNFRS